MQVKVSQRWQYRHQISFPKKLYTEKYRDSFLRENIGNKKISELAAELGYTERRINDVEPFFNESIEQAKKECNYYDN